MDVCFLKRVRPVSVGRGGGFFGKAGGAPKVPVRRKVRAPPFHDVPPAEAFSFEEARDEFAELVPELERVSETRARVPCSPRSFEDVALLLRELRDPPRPLEKPRRLSLLSVRTGLMDPAGV